MLLRGKRRRVGITLIELLVVIAIIAILLSLITAAAMRALSAGPKADTTARMANITAGVGAFKSHDSFGRVAYIPAGRYEPVANPNAGVPAPGWYAFRLRNSYPAATSDPREPNAYSFEAQYLQKVFGGGHGLNLDDLGFRDNSGQPVLRADLDANQTLAFFLGGIPESQGAVAIFTGFSMNPRQPFVRRDANRPDEKRRGPILDMSDPRRYTLDGGFARLTDGYGLPFLYFTALEGRENAAYGGFNPLAPGVLPYSRGGQYENAKGFQLISAGKNEAFGPGGDWSRVDAAGEDDMANFSPNLIGSVP